MQIGELAKITDTPIETIRYYEREGLIAPAQRSTGNYRNYSNDHLEQLRFIRNCRALAMSLEEIRELLQLRDPNSGNCQEVDQIVDRHLEHLSNRIDELRRLETELRAIRAVCGSSNPKNECQILGALAAKRDPTKQPVHRHIASTHPTKSDPSAKLS